MTRDQAIQLGNEIRRVLRDRVRVQTASRGRRFVVQVSLDGAAWQDLASADEVQRFILGAL